MRITILTPNAGMSGGARVNHIYAKALQQRGHTVCLVTRPLARRTFRSRVKSLLRGNGWPTANPPVPQSHFDPADYVIKTLDTARPITAQDVPDADVVIATWWETAEWMLTFPPSKGRQVHFVQGYEAFYPAQKHRVDQTLRAASFKITISRWLEEMLVKSFDNQSVRKILNSVDTEQFSSPRRTRQDHPTIGMVYSLTDCKDCRTGFEAINLLRQRLPNLQLKTFGHLAESSLVPMPHGVQHTVLPAQRDIRNIYGSCDVWFCSSISEGFGLPLLEAMACRCPVVSTVSGGPEDFIEEGINGFFVPVGDAGKMADKLEYFFSLNANRWQTMSDAAYATAVDYTWDDAADLFEKALYEAIEH